jgi:hypothetical protein
MDLADYHEYAASWTLNQIAILEVHPKSYRQPHIKIGYLNVLDTDKVVNLGEFSQIEPEDMSTGQGYTYFMDTKEYYTCAKG